jgi:hypothetical protein
VSVADLITALDDRAIGALILVFAIPNAMPLPPGASTVLGAPLLFLTAQLAFGRRAWLPAFITRRAVERAHFARVVKRIAPVLAKAETLLRPRLEFLVRPPFQNLIGVICFLLAIVLFLPIPMGNIPPAAAICLFALALLERDGLCAILGSLVTIAAIALVWGILFALFESGILLFAKFVR